MQCREFEKLIPAFLQDKMNYLLLKEFAEHAAVCESCKEELTIQFLIAEGMARLEEGSAFDLQKELDDRMGRAGRKVRFHERFLRVGLALEALVMLGIAAVVFLIIF